MESSFLSCNRLCLYCKQPIKTENPFHTRIISLDLLFIIFLLPVILHTDLIVKLEKMGLNIQISALIILTLVFLCPFIHGWGIDGHFTICRIAQVTSIYTQISSFFFFIYVLEFKILGFQCFSHMI